MLIVFARIKLFKSNVLLLNILMLKHIEKLFKITIVPETHFMS